MFRLRSLTNSSCHSDACFFLFFAAFDFFHYNGMSYWPIYWLPPSLLEYKKQIFLARMENLSRKCVMMCKCHASASFRIWIIRLIYLKIKFSILYFRGEIRLLNCNKAILDHVFNCESKQFNNLSDQFVCLSVCATFEILLLKGSSSQSEHSLRLTNQSEDSILSAVSADISCSIKTQSSVWV